MASSEEHVTNVLSFDTTDNGMTIFDHIERQQCKMSTAEPVSIQQVSLDKFRFPVDQGISILTSKISINHTMAVCLRNNVGVMIEELTKGDTQTLPYDEYTIELSSPIKLYIVVKSDFEINVTSEQVILDFEELEKLYIGARSHHKRPSATIKTTSDPEDLIQAVSYFGSALKTTSCERSYPTLRGHPPDFSLNNELVIPSILEKVDTGVTVQIPADYESIFVIAPLVYYLGAEVISGETAKIKTKDGFEHELESTKRKFEEEVERVLKQCFFLDCLTRTEGYFQIELHERKQVESDLNLNFSLLYDKPVSEQIRSYLSISYEKISNHIPMWKKIAHMKMERENIEFLPYLTNDLSIIVPGGKTNGEDEDSESIRSGQLSRNTNVSEGLVCGSSTTDGDYRTNESIDQSEEYIKISRSGVLEHTWIGDKIPIGASKGMLTAFENQLNQTPRDGNIDITVIVNDDQMIQEGTSVNEVYNSRDQLALNTELYHQLTTEELREVFHKRYDFLHYIGHIDENGFDCTDGKLNATNIGNVSIRTFLLNACTSYQQAIEFIRSGAVAGIATTKPILNSGAERVGKAIAKLLNLGFPLISALKISKSESIMGENYVVIGDGSVNLTQAKSGIPSLCEIEPDKNGLNVIYKTFITGRKGLGTITIPYAKDNSEYFLTSGKTGRFKMNKNELLRFVSMGEMPVKIGSLLFWGDENEFINRLKSF